MPDAPKKDVSDASGARPQKVAAPTQPPTGLRDLYPAELNRLRFIQQAWRETSISHGFEEIDGPTFEDADLYAVKSGEGILNECFGVFSGKNTEERARLAAGGNAPYALRPEFTPTLARMYAARAGALPKPTKWFWTQNCFRAERPQRGRLREFYQWNCDIIGEDSPEADAELVVTCAAFLHTLGLGQRNVVVRVSDRRVFAAICQELGFTEIEVPLVADLMDQRAKLTPDQFAWKAGELGLKRESVVALNDLISNVNDWGFERVCREMFPEDSPHHDVGKRFWKLGQILDASGLMGAWKFDPSIVRGLAYYTGMVFEVHEASGAERAIAGGGRYDNLIELFGGPPTPAVGFGMGDVVLSLVLQDKGLMPSDDLIAERLGLRPDAFVISNGTPEADAQVAPALAALRKGSPTQRPLHARRSYKTTKNVGKLIQDAAKSRARFCVIIESGTHCTLKNLDTQQEEKNIPLGDVRSRVS